MCFSENGRHRAAAWLLLVALTLVQAGQTVRAEDAPLTVTIAYSDSFSSGAGERDALLSHLSERFGIHLESVKTPAVDAGNTYRLWAATGNLPDVFIHDSDWDFYFFINCGAISPLPDSLTAYPHLKQLIAYPYARLVQYDGKIWGIPRGLYAEEKGAQGSCVIMHADIYDALGLAAQPASLEEYAGMLRAVREWDEEIIPLTSYTPQAMFDLVYYEAPFRDTWIWNGTRYEPGFITGGYRDSILRLSSLWEEGLLDPGFMEGAGNPTGMDRFILRQAAAMVYTVSPYEWLSDLAARWARLYPDTPLSEGVRLLYLPADTQGEYYAPKVANTSFVYLRSGLEEGKQERILSLLDYLYSPEGKRLRRYGIEGEDYHIDESGQVVRKADEQGRPISLYEKYPSYALLRTLPDLDMGFATADETVDADVSALLGQYWDWYGSTSMREIYTTSLICNTTSTPSGEGFNPRIAHNAFRMLCAGEALPEVLAEIEAEYRAQGLDRIIDEVNWFTMAVP